MRTEQEPSPQHYQLEVWKSAMRLVRRIYELSSDFPDQEKFGLCSQMRKCAISVPSNIAEGASRGSRKDFVRFLLIARSSLMELDTQLWLAKDLGFVSNIEDVQSQVYRILAMLNGLIRNRSKP